MGDDPKTKEVVKRAEAVLTQFANLGWDIDAIAKECKVISGESLYDRMNKCVAAIRGWDGHLATMQSEMAALKKACAALKDKSAGSPAALAAAVLNVAEQRISRTVPIIDSYRKGLGKHLEKLKKLKIP